MTVRIETQGIRADFGAATGDYATIEFGELSERDLVGMLERLAHLPPLPDGTGQDLCPPTVIARGRKTHTFTHDGRGLYCLEIEEYVDPTGGAAVAFEGASRSGRAKRRRRYPKGHVPLVYPDLEPTIDTLGAADIDRSSAVFAGEVGAESKTPRQTMVVGLVVLPLGLVVFGMLLSANEWNTAAFVTALVCTSAGLVLFGWGWMNRREHLAAGIDWNNNYLWTLRGGRNRGAVNANCITAVDVEQTVEWVPSSNPDHPNTTEKFWSVIVRYSGASYMLTRFKKRAEGERLAEALRGALGAAAAPSAGLRRYAPPPVKAPPPVAVASPVAAPPPMAQSPAAGAPHPPVPATPTAASTCLQCGGALAGGAKFCEQCGTAARAGCPRCGVPAKPGTSFCGTCGGPLSA